MSKYLKYIMILISLLIIIFIIYVIIKYVLLYIKIKKSILNVLINNTKCGKPMCLPTSSQTTVPIPISISVKDWQLNTAKYCSTIVYSIEDATKNHTKPVYPADLTVLEEIYENDDNPLIGVIFSSDSNKLWIAFRGSQTPDDWKEDFNLQQEYLFSSKGKKFGIQTQKHFLSDIKVNGISPNIHKGFVDVYEKVRSQIINTIKINDPNKLKTIIVTGHSLGAAIATLTGIDLIKNGYLNNIVYTFASPRIGDQLFADLVNNSLKLYRIVNVSDVIPNLPLAVEPNFVNPENPLIYEHCGEVVYFSDNWFSIVNNHLMPIYMTGLENM